MFEVRQSPSSGLGWVAIGVVLAAVFFPTCKDKESDAPQTADAPLTVAQMRQHLQAWRQVIADRQDTIWLQQTAVMDSLQRVDFEMASRIETLQLAEQREQDDPRRAEIADAIRLQVSDWTARMEAFESKLAQAKPIADAFNIVRSAVTELTFLESAGVNVREAQATVRESSNLHREARKLWHDQMRRTIDGHETDPLLLQSGLSTATRAVREARSIQARLSKVKTTVTQRQNLRVRMKTRLSWAEEFLGGLDEAHSFREGGVKVLSAARTLFVALDRQAVELDRKALDPSRDFEKIVRDHREDFAKALHDLNATFIPEARKAGWPLPR